MEDRFRSKRRKVAKSKKHFVDEEIEDTEGVDFGDDPEGNNPEDKEDEEVDETADEKRIRMAKEYLSRLEKSVGADDIDAKLIDKEIIASRLKQDVAEKSQNVQKIASKIKFQETSAKILKGHSLPLTCVAISEDDQTCFTGSKDSSVIHWDVETGKKLHRFHGEKLKKHTKEKSEKIDGHTGHVLSVAVSSDGQYLITGGTDRAVRLWDLRSYTLIEKLKGHRAPVTGLKFQHGSNTFFSSSEDRTIRVWDAGTRAYIDSLYGHQAEVLAVDSLSKERAVSVGKDKSVRYWKVPEETQLLFEPPKAKSLLQAANLAHPHFGVGTSFDCVALSDDQHFVSGGDDGCLAYWSTQRKRAITVVEHAHPYTPTSEDTTEEGSKTEVEDKDGWVTAVTAGAYSDLVFSGSWNGQIKIWSAAPTALHSIGSIQVGPGFVNGMALSHGLTSHSGPKKGFLAVAMGREPRLGRWITEKSGCNGLMIIPASLQE